MKKILFTIILSFILLKGPVYAMDDPVAECLVCKNEPPCCAQIVATHDPYQCENFIDRMYCKPSTCSQIDGKTARCGWYWLFHNANDNEYHLGTNTPVGYGCMIGDTEATMRPRCDPTPIPTSTPIPTPSPIPTTPPKSTSPPSPTQKPLPTEEQLLPTQKPSPLSTQSPIQPVYFDIPNTSTLPPSETPPVSFQLPQFSLPLVQIPTIPITCSISPSTIDPISYIFDKVTYYDRAFENTINVQFILFYHFLKSKISL